jgi:hypothetical protein
MKPKEALYSLVNLSGVYVPQIYRDMPREQLRELVDECDKPTPTEISEKALARWARQPLRMPWFEREEQARKEKAEQAAAAEPAPEPIREPQTPVARALADDRRLSSTVRRKAAFRHHYARCSSVTEAAIRAGVDRRTVNRWRARDPAFDAKCRDILAMRRRMAEEDVVLAAGQIEVRPLFYRGRRLGQITRRDRALDLYLLKRADAEALRAEQHREAARTADRDFEARVQAEVEKRLSRMSRSAGHDPMTAEDEFTCVSIDIPA